MGEHMTTKCSSWKKKSDLFVFDGEFATVVLPRWDGFLAFPDDGMVALYQ